MLILEATPAEMHEDPELRQESNKMIHEHAMVARLLRGSHPVHLWCLKPGSLLHLP